MIYRPSNRRIKLHGSKISRIDKESNLAQFGSICRSDPASAPGEARGAAPQEAQSGAAPATGFSPPFPPFTSFYFRHYQRDATLEVCGAEAVDRKALILQECCMRRQTVAAVDETLTSSCFQCGRN